MTSRISASWREMRAIVASLPDGTVARGEEIFASSLPDGVATDTELATIVPDLPGSDATQDNTVLDNHEAGAEREPPWLLPVGMRSRSAGAPVRRAAHLSEETIDSARGSCEQRREALLR